MMTARFIMTTQPARQTKIRMNIQELVATSLLVVCDRRKRFASNQTIPDYIQHVGLCVIDKIISALKTQNSSPFTLEKCFLSDLAVTMTNVWEAYSIDESGQFH